MTYTKRIKLISSSFLLWLFLVTPTWAGVGYILLINGPAEDFQLIRKNNSHPESIAVNTAVETGDRLVPKPNRSPKSSLLLWLSNGETVTVTSSYTVTTDQSVPNVLSGFIASLGTWFESLQEHQSRMSSLYTRGTPEGQEPLKMPLFPQEQLLVAGPSTLFLSWQGGQSPYQVQVAPQGLAPLLNQEVRQATSMTMDRSRLTSGHYIVDIRDAKGHLVHGNIRVVATATFSEAPQVQAIQTLPTSSENRQTLLASWLAQRAEWRLEAYQQVAGIATKKFEPALLVKEGLEGGK